MNWFRNAALCAVCAAIVSPVCAASTTGSAYLYQSLDSAGFSVVTSDEELPALLYLDEYYGIASIEEHAPLADGVLAELYYPNGNVVVISSGVASDGGASPAQSETAPLVADTCDAEAFETGLPYVIAASDLPYSQTFDTTLATDTGDYRGSSADSISRPGGHDGFLMITPDQDGAYFFTNSATKGETAPILEPGHEFERGFGGIGVWTGNCDDGFVEVGTANSIVGDSQLSVQLEADVTYYVIWEDFFVGSLENSVTISIEFLGGPIGNTLTDSVSLVDEGWNFEIVGDTSTNTDMEDSSCVEPVDGEGHGAGSGLTGAEIWYRLPSVEVGGEYTVNVLSSSEEEPFVDSALVLHAYNLMTHQVAEVACNNDISEEDRLSSIMFTAEENLIYYVMVESVPAFDQAAFGTFILQGLAGTSSVANWENY